MVQSFSPLFINKSDVIYQNKQHITRDSFYKSTRRGIRYLFVPMHRGNLKEDTEVRFLPMTDQRKLGEIMAINEDWQRFMSLIPKNISQEQTPKFTTENIQTLNRSLPSSSFDTGMELLLFEWSDMSIGPGGKRPTIGYVRDLCLQGGFIRAADYLNHFVLRGQRILGCDSVPESEPQEEEEESFDDVSQEDLIKWDSIISEDMTSSSTILNDSTQSVPFSDSYPFIPVNDLRVHSFPLKYIRRITKNFAASDHTFRIGSGGYSEVFKGLTGQNRIVAVKRLRNTERKEYQFNNEIETIPNLFHPNIIKILGYSNESPDHLCLIYPFMENGSLEDRLEREPHLTWPEKLNISQGIISGIVFLHEGTQKELIHRDIKTANVLIDINLRPKIIDFGFLYSKSRDGDSQSPDQHSETLAQRGTSAYMAPEVIYNIVHAKLDVFSFGVILIELITGLKAFDENREDRDLATYIQDHPSYLDLIDKKSPPWNRKRIENWFGVALECTEQDYIIRPKSRSVQVKLMEI